jgi:hypothetical protein
MHSLFILKKRCHLVLHGDGGQVELGLFMPPSKVRWASMGHFID